MEKVISIVDMLNYFFSHAFADLKKLSEKKTEFFTPLFIGRDDSRREMEYALSRRGPRGENIVVLGEAGVGKSNFLYDAFMRGDVFSGFSMFPIMIDWEVLKTVDECKKRFIDSMTQYFKEINFEIVSLKENSDENVAFNFRETEKHLADIKPWCPVKKRPVLFIDDLDYAEEEWLELLQDFLAIASSEKISVVLSVRPPLLTCIRDFDGRFFHRYIGSAKMIELNDLPISDVLISRLAHILKDGELEIGSPFRDVWNKIFDLKRVAFNPLPKIEYPFSKAFESFMVEFTNGNNRHVFSLASQAIRYCRFHKDGMKAYNSDGKERCFFSEEDITDMLFPSDHNKGDVILMDNLFEVLSRDGHPLYYDILEQLRQRRSVDDFFYSNLKKRGHKSEQVNAGLTWLADRSKSYIYPTNISVNNKKNSKHKVRRYAAPHKSCARTYKYGLTRKSVLYMDDITRWTSYKDRVGDVSI